MIITVCTMYNLIDLSTILLQYYKKNSKCVSKGLHEFAKYSLKISIQIK